MKTCFALFLLTCAALAQNTITGTVTDPNGNPYANGTASAVTVPATGHASVSTTPVPTNASGFFTLSLASNTYIFTICAPPTNLGVPTANPTPVQVCFSSQPIVINSTADISTQLNAVAVVIGPKASGVAAGTPNFFSIYNSGSSIGPDGNLSDVSNVITSLAPFTTPQVNLSGTGGLVIFGPGGALPNVVSGSGGFGVLTGGLPQINVNGSWFYPSYLSVGGTALSQNQANLNNTTPAAPSNGLNIQWQNSGANLSAAIVGDGNAAHCLLGTGAFGACGSGSAGALSALTAATGSNTIANGNNPQTWNWALTSNSINGITFGETSAATGTGESVVGVSTASASTATPLTITQGSITGTTAIPAFTLNSTFNNASLVGNLFAINLTNTSSNASSTIANWSVGGTSQFQVDIGGDLGIAGSLHMLQTTGTLQACGGSSISCQSSTNGSNGPIQAQGEDSISTGASAKAGPAIFRGGILNSTPNAAALEGVAQLGAGFNKGSAIAAVGDVVCGTTTAFTVTDCSHTGPAVNIVGIANTTANPIGVVMDGNALVKFDGAVTLGDIACMGTTTDGQAHDNGTAACSTAGTTIGVIIADSGTIQQMSGVSQASTAMSTTLALVQLHIGK